MATVLQTKAKAFWSRIMALSETRSFWRRRRWRASWSRIGLRRR
jgi:hypothetical protein